MTDPTPPPNYAPDYQPQWSTWTRRLVVVILLIAGVYALTLFTPVIPMVTLAFLLAFLLYAPSRAIVRRTPVPYPLAVVLLYLLIILALLFMALVLIPAFVSGINSLIGTVEQAYTDLQATLRAYQPQHGVVTVLGIDLDLNFLIEPVRNFVLGTQVQAAPTAEPGPSPDTITTPTPEGAPAGEAGDSSAQTIDLRQLVESLVNVAGTVTGTLTSAITGVTGFVVTLVMALLISFLILLDVPRLQKAFVEWVPAAYHREYVLLIRQIIRVWNGFFRGQVIIGVIIGVATWLQLTLMGVRNAEILAVFTGLISLIPTLGGIIALIPLGLVPLLEGSSVFTDMSNGTFALLVVGVNLAISQAVWNAVAPKILGDALDLPLPVIIIGVFIGAAVGGILGAFLVAPVIGTIRVILVYVLNKLSLRDPFPGEEAAVAWEEGLLRAGPRRGEAEAEPVAQKARS